TDGKGGIQFQLADNPNFENVTSKRVTVGPVIISNTGIDLGGQKITHVQAGTKDDDAVNVSQLNNVKNIASAGWNIQTDSGKQQISNIGSNNTMAINGDRNISVTNNGNNVSVSLNNDIMLGSDNNSINQWPYGNHFCRFR
ncbi:hypothetical protein, partial [Serratia marcescens]|uniref:hypothetical protein n=1 Tax=Serratia marcescens TaxID=615 RepID=UPI000D90D01F